ncbi:MAG: hydrogenase maturation protease [Acidobacteriota bacterium]|nr:hydrogenase maturation protease [Acidobacteriota bacterium]
MVIGVGNPLRGDDGVGAAVVRRLRTRVWPGVAVRELDGDGTALMEQWSGAAAVVVVDAMVSGAAPGTIARFDAVREPLPAGAFHLSTHALGLSDAIELARAMEALPPSLIVYGVEGEGFDAGAPLSAAVAAAVPVVAERIAREIAAAV